MKSLLCSLITLLSISTSFAGIPGFELLDGSYNPAGDGEVVIKNMPSVRSQDGIGLCGAFTAAAVLEHQYCKVNNIQNCSSLPNDQRVSVLDISRFSVDLNKVKDATNPDSYPKSIQVDGTSSIAMLINAGYLAESVVPESCAPFDGFVARTKNLEEATQAEAAIWKNFKATYDSFKSKSKQCAECALEEATAAAQQWKQNYNLKVDNVEMLKAFSAKTYQEFLSQLLIPKSCYKIGEDIQIPTYGTEVDYWPKNKKKESYESKIEKIKSVLKTDQPVIAGVCLLDKVTPNCTEKTKGGEVAGGHSVVITGYRKMCNSKGNCYETLKIHNSWGQSWQDQNNDGWVRADSFLKQTGYDAGTFVFLKDKS